MNWNRFSQELKGGCGLLACSLTFLFGSLDNLLQVFLALLALDYFTGVLASFISGKLLNSRKGLEGIANANFAERATSSRPNSLTVTEF